MSGRKGSEQKGCFIKGLHSASTLDEGFPKDGPGDSDDCSWECITLLLLFSKDMIWWAEVTVKFLGLKEGQVAQGIREDWQKCHQDFPGWFCACRAHAVEQREEMPQLCLKWVKSRNIIQQHRAGCDRPVYQYPLPTTQSAERYIISRNLIIISGGCFLPEQSSIQCHVSRCVSMNFLLSCLLSQPPVQCFRSLWGRALACRSLTRKSQPEGGVSFFSEDLGRKRQFMTVFVELGIYPKEDVGILALVLCGVNGQEWSVRALNSPFLIAERFSPQNFSWHCGTLRVCSHSG